MSAAPPLAAITVGVVVERVKGSTPWTDYLWQPVEILPGVPETTAWTQLSGDDDRARFYAGEAVIELHRIEAPNYRENLGTGAPKLWVALRATDAEPPYHVHAVTADPAEGEALTEAGSDIVEAVAMPPGVLEAVAAFVVDNDYERVFVKRKRDRQDSEALGRRDKTGGNTAGGNMTRDHKS